MTTAPDPYNLNRFVTAQDRDYARALAEIRQGRKVSHWMWYVFPQIQGLGLTSTSRLYAISGADEARAYLAHPVLGPRLVECFEAVLQVQGRTAREIFGVVDAMKLRSSATLFAAVSQPGSVFQQVLDRYFPGEPCQRTLATLGQT